VCAFLNEEPEVAYYILGYKVVENVSRALDAVPLGRGFSPRNFYLFIPDAVGAFYILMLFRLLNCTYSWSVMQKENRIVCTLLPVYYF
jgi:hypothetical protein